MESVGLVGPVADRVFMARAIRLGKLGLYTTDPNPRVGCVIVKEGVVVGEGWHRRAGELHAEPLALAAAGATARGATAYVSLEPCCHHGRTPPCTDALLAAGVARVVVAMRDPNPLVSGSGLDLLRARGVAVEEGLLEAQARRLNPGFIKRMQEGLPYVRCKLAASLDGRTAMASGESQWITSAAARRDVQLLRARSSAILTGIGTLLADDPSLNVRLTAAELVAEEVAASRRSGVRPAGTAGPGEPGELGEPVKQGEPGMPGDPGYSGYSGCLGELGFSGDSGDQSLVRQPLRVVVDSRLRTPPSAKMLSLPGRTLIACLDPDADRPPRDSAAEGAARLKAAGADILRVPPGSGGLDLEFLLRYLARMEINEVLIEAGATLAGAALQAGLVDELVLYLAPHIMGDAGRGLFHLPGLERMGDRLPLHIQDLRMIGPDLRLTALREV